LKLVTKGFDIQQNILKKELQSQTLSPGAARYGFLYLPIPKGAAPRDKIQLKIRLKRSDTDTPVDFDLVF
jgi:hypothetical protein